MTMKIFNSFMTFLPTERRKVDVGQQERDKKKGSNNKTYFLLSFHTIDLVFQKKIDLIAKTNYKWILRNKYYYFCSKYVIIAILCVNCVAMFRVSPRFIFNE